MQKNTFFLWNFAGRETVALGTVDLNNKIMQNKCKTSCEEFLVLQKKARALSMESQLKAAETPWMELGSMEVKKEGGRGKRRRRTMDGLVHLTEFNSTSSTIEKGKKWKVSSLVYTYFYIFKRNRLLTNERSYVIRNSDRRSIP
jgi:hypothetical protein